ncbi:hypothetical protein BOX15_Mlig019947g1 [Macrostomum lignano]|uniref:TPR_REGION domain-containing protein n=1 Tax=Macrostomum lignano TaxID=282301 RepID=A0A267FMT1_9PLAT|nr:hypothetical protein BOX15_Mlig019947g1 [Macrostomum lignano]
MDSQTIKNARAAANIHFAINLLQEGINALLKRHCGLQQQQQPDFNTCLQVVETQITKLLPDQSCQDQLLKTMQLARATRNRYSHQDFDVNRFEHDVECLLKLASLLGLTECREQIMSFTGCAGTSGEDWEKLKIEGNEHYKNLRCTEAMNCYTGAIHINSTEAVLYSNRALCEIQLRKFDLAREDAEEAIVLNPQQVKFYRILSEALYDLELYEEAVDACKDGLKIDPRDETLLVRSRDCQALVADAKIKEHPVGGGFNHIKTPEVSRNLSAHFLKQASDVSDEDAYQMNMVHLQTAYEISKAHRILHAGKGKVEEEKKALEIYQSAAERGSAEGLYNMAVMFKEGLAGWSKNPKKYFELCHEAAAQKPYLKTTRADIVFPNIGVAEAENAIAMAYRDGFNVDQDDKLAFQWFLKSAEHGCPSGMNNLGLALYRGSGCKKNLNSARCWYQKSADLGLAEAQSNLAEMLVKGEGGPQDASKAAGLLKAAAKQGLPGALIVLQQLQCSGASGAESLDASKKILQGMLDSDDKQALFVMGMNRLTGDGGFQKDLSQAEKCFRKASDLNHKEATFKLGCLLLNQRKSEDAVSFIRVAAESGNKDAQKLYGHILALGHGCDRDVTQAHRWLLRSTEGQTAVDQFIELSNEVVKFEASKTLSIRDLTYPERIDRFMESYLPSGKTKEAFSNMFLNFRQAQENPPHPGRGSFGFDYLAALPTMIVRAAQGSKKAESFFESLNIFDQAKSELKNNNTNAAFRLYRQADRVWHPLPLDMETFESLFSAAMKAFERNPRDADALYVIIHYKTVSKSSSNSELLRMALQCTSLNPDVADYHNLVGNLYGFCGEYMASVRSFEQALELEWEPDWLYGKATSLRLKTSTNQSASRADRQIVIDAYEKYISSNEPDSRHIPKAFFSIATEYLLLMETKKAREFYDKGLHADSMRLPCFDSNDDFPPKKYLSFFFK